MHKNDLKRLVIFVQVVLTGSFAGAAKRLQLPRSSVSEHVSALERSLGTRLLQRTTRKLSLTPEGRGVFEKAQSINILLDEINSLNLTQEASGIVTISLTEDIAQTWLVPRLVDFYARYPNITVRLLIDDFISDLIGDQIDLALRVTSPDKAYSLVGRTLHEESTRFYASPTYIERYGLPKSIADLTDHRWILLKQISPQGDVLIRTNNQSNKFKPIYFHETDSPQVQRCMMEHGLGIGLHLPSVAAPSVSLGLLQQVLPESSSMNFVITLVYPSRQLPLRTRLLAEFLVESGWP